jgi:PTS system ascorbate-specific IIB component
MKHLRIMTVCGFGLGTSLVLRMTVDEVLQKYKIKAETFCSDADTAVGQNYDMVITSGEMERLFQNVDQPVVVIKNFLSKDEVEQKALPVIRDLVADKE